jgi:hypothetical protein
MRAGTSKRNWLLFWCPIRHKAKQRLRPNPEKERTATVDVLVFGWLSGRSSSRWLHAPVSAEFMRWPGDCAAQ